MGTVDEYLRYQVTPQLRPGEQIVGMGLVRKPSHFNLVGIPEKYEEWLATATSKRLILFRTDGSGLHTVNPRPQCLEVREWWYQELAQVVLGQVGGIGGGIHFGLVPRDGMGPLEGKNQRYDLFPRVENLDGHADFFQRFPGWISQQVAAGAFPLDQEGLARQHAIGMQRQQQAAMAQHQQVMASQQAAVERDARAKALHPIGWFVTACALTFATVGAGATGLYFQSRASRAFVDGIDANRSVRDYREQVEAAKKKGFKSEVDSLEYSLGTFEARAELAEERHAELGMYAYGSFGAAGLTFVGAVAVWLGWRKRNKAPPSARA